MVEKPDERLLPTNKVRTIMKSCGDPSAILSKESVLVVTKAAVNIFEEIPNEPINCVIQFIRFFLCRNYSFRI